VCGTEVVCPAIRIMELTYLRSVLFRLAPSCALRKPSSISLHIILKLVINRFVYTFI
jgi:hypothetical protein